MKIRIKKQAVGGGGDKWESIETAVHCRTLAKINAGNELG